MVDTDCYRRTKFVCYHKKLVECHKIGNNMAELIHFTSNGSKK
jgi:hypothetical protein